MRGFALFVNLVSKIVLGANRTTIDIALQSGLKAGQATSLRRPVENYSNLLPKICRIIVVYCN